MRGMPMPSLIKSLRMSDTLTEKLEATSLAGPTAFNIAGTAGFANLLPWLCLSATTVAAFNAGSNMTAQATIAVVFVCAAVAGIAGFAFSALAGALLFHLHVDPVSTIEL